ncbi:hypothetical protein VRY85_02500 [Achromobacter sp. F4_2707]|uniref:hypothetical protein n=1 Tax=Achromobacter sp. F4_2707 TaxID=3114286 RepID=UPI0039C6B7E0
MFKIKSKIKKLRHINIKDTSKKIKKCDVLLFCHDADRGVDLNGKAYSPLIDSFREELEKLGYVCQTIAHPWSKLGAAEAFGSPILCNFSFLLSLIYKKIGISKNSTINFYKKIFEKSSPNIIITIGCNDILCEAAWDLGIFHVELLHGIGYNPIPWNWDKKNKKNLPRAILSLDTVSTKTFSALEKKGVKIIEIEHPFLKRFNKENAKSLPEEWKPPLSNKNYEKEILISLQWGYASGIDAKDGFDSKLENGLFHKEIEDVISLSHETVYWRFRFHPVQYRQPEKYKKLFNFMDNFIKKHPNCDWEESTHKPLPSILSQCTGHITMCSMVSYEAAYMGIQTLALSSILKKGRKYENYFTDLEQSGYLEKKEATFEDIRNWVNSVQKKEPFLQSSNTKTIEQAIKIMFEKSQHKPLNKKL